MTKTCEYCGKHTQPGSVHTCSPQIRPKGGVCQACEHLPDDCSAFAKPNPDWPAEAEERMDIIGQNGNTGDHYEPR